MKTTDKKPITLNKDTAKQVGRALTGEYSFVLSFLVLTVIGVCINPNIFTWGNISNLFVQGCMIGLIAMGMTMVIGAGMIDISVGAQVALIGGFGIKILNATNNVWIMLLFCVAAGLGIGLINGRRALHRVQGELRLLPAAGHRRHSDWQLQDSLPDADLHCRGDSL